MICPKCSFEQPDGQEQCLRCGVLFAKIRIVPAKAAMPGASEGETPSIAERLKQRILDVPAEANGLVLAGRFSLWVVLLIWGIRFMVMPIQGETFNQSLMHLINLPFHEAGHIIFTPFGRLIQVFGGTLGQWLIPFIVICSFLLRNNPFAASVGLWWLGQSFMDIAPYMDDARAGQLMLLGGVTGSEVEDYHDWEVILTSLGLMQYDHIIARISFGCGILMMVAALAWGGWVLYRQKGSNGQP
jgi:hypothetical protein